MKENAIYVQESEFGIHEKPKTLGHGMITNVNDGFGRCGKETPMAEVVDGGRISKNFYGSWVRCRLRLGCIQRRPVSTPCLITTRAGTLWGCEPAFSSRDAPFQGHRQVDR